MDMTKLSSEAERALTNAQGTHIGAMVADYGPAGQELIDRGLIGIGHGLTRAGSIRAQQLKSAQEQELFPL